MEKRNSKVGGAWRNSFGSAIDQRLDEIRSSLLTRAHRILGSSQKPNAVVDGVDVLNFCSNDYLGLADNPLLKEAARSAVDKYGLGSGASHLVIGHHQLHENLAAEIAQFTSRDKALIFSSGYLANLAAVSSLVGKGDVVLQDRLNHASLIDGGILSGARFKRYLHCDSLSLKKSLNYFSEKQEHAKRLVVTDGVFSMDGDIAPLDKLSKTCEENNALLMVDDAHGLGVIGEKGKGSVDYFGLDQEKVPVLMGTFGKALGTSGAFIAGPEDVIDFIMQVGRPYIYTTALPPAIAAATSASLKYIANADEQRAHLNHLIRVFRREMSVMGYQLMESQTPIQPVLVGDSAKALSLSECLLKQGVLVGAIRPPTVPVGSARLRVTLSARHSLDDLDQLLHAFQSAITDGCF